MIANDFRYSRVIASPGRSYFCGCDALRDGPEKCRVHLSPRVPATPPAPAPEPQPMVKVNVHMLQQNKHFMANHGLVDVAPIPAPTVPVALTVLPMESAAQLCIDISVGEFVTVCVHLIEGTQTWVRIPERRSVERRQAVAAHLREVAGLYSLPSFLRYIADCGFIRQ